MTRQSVWNTFLRQHELLVDGAKPALPADFLMEMMDINERLMEVDDSEQWGEINSEVLAIEGDIYTKLHHLTTGYAQINAYCKRKPA